MSNNSVTPGKVIDMHVHIGGTGKTASGQCSNSECIMSKKFTLSPSFAAMLMALHAVPGLDVNDDRIREIILRAITDAAEIDAVVLLALDGVFRKGEHTMCKPATHLYTPNSYVRNIAKENPKVLFGASIHPYDSRSVARAEECLKPESHESQSPSAVLFKWIPSAQQIDPADDACIPFYELLAEKKVPLLCHTGAEHSIPTSDAAANRFNNPCRLLKPLRLGVRVIAAHCATAFWGERFEQDCFEDFLCLLQDHEFLYADLAAFCWPQRIPYLRRIAEEINKHRISADKFVFGSDFPVPIFDINLFDARPLLPSFKSDDVKQIKRLLADHPSPLSANYNYLRQFAKRYEIPELIFTNAERILNLPASQHDCSRSPKRKD